MPESSDSTGKSTRLALADPPSSPQPGPSTGGRGAGATARSRKGHELDTAVAVALRSLRRNAVLNVTVRSLLAMWALVAAALAIAYTATRSDTIVATLTSTSSTEPFAVRLLSLSLPALLLAGLGAMCSVAAWLLHSRGREDLERGMECVSRLQREAEVAITARGLTHVFEEKLATARRGFSLQLWLGRTLFLVSLTLFSAALANAIATGVDLATVALGAGSLLTALYGTARSVPKRIACHLADVLQMQCAITGCIRQISLIEAEAYALLCKHKDDPETVVDAVAECQRAIDVAVERTIVLIQRYADPDRSLPASE